MYRETPVGGWPAFSRQADVEEGTGDDRAARGAVRVVIDRTPGKTTVI
jgi:hypothetical protein